MTDLLRRLATGRSVILALAAATLLGVALSLWGPGSGLVALGGLPLPDQRFWQPADLESWLGTIGEAGRAAYRTFLLFDGAYLTLVVTPAFMLLTAWVLGKLVPTRPGLAALAWLLVLVAAADMVENVILFQAAGRFPDLAGLPLALASRATAVKTGLATVLHPLPLLAALVYLSMELGRAARRRQVAPR